METQTWMFALVRAVNKEHDPQLQFTLFVSFTTLIKALFDARCQLANLLGTHQQLMDQMKLLMDDQPLREWDMAENNFMTPIEELKAWLMGLPEPGELPEGVLLKAR